MSNRPPAVELAGARARARRVDAPAAILQHDTGARLDAIVRRLGGTPKAVTAAPRRPTFPPVGPHVCADQLPMPLDDSPGREE